MSEYRKKPVVVQAHKWDPQQKPTEIPAWLWNHLAAYPDNFNEKTAYKKLSEQWNKDSLDLIKLMPMLTAHNVAAVLDRLAREGVK